jgi:hypothetical protein
VHAKLKLMATRWHVIRGILFLVVSLVLSYAFYYYEISRPFSASLPPDMQLLRFIPAVLGALFLEIVISIFNSAVYEFRQAKFISRSTSGSLSPTKDGDRICISGQIFPSNTDGIISPITSQNCVFYSYDIYQIIRRGTGRDKNIEKESDYSGLQLTPSYISCQLGKLKILSLPITHDHPPATYSYSPETANYYLNAKNYISAALFTDITINPIAKTGSFIHQLKDILTDNDGYIRQDNRYSNQTIDINTRFLEESFLPVGELVTAIGAWSQAGGGIISDFKRGIGLTIYKGPPENAVKAARNGGYKKLAEACAVFIIIHTILGFFWYVGRHPGQFKSSYTRTSNGLTTTTYYNPAPSPLPPAPPQTPDWATYLNSDSGYTYSYPSVWINRESQTSGWNELTQSEFKSTTSTVGTGPGTPVVLAVSYLIDGGTCTEGKNNRELLKGTDFSDITVSGQKGKSFELTSENDIYYSKYIYIPRDDKCFLILIQDYKNNPNKEIFDQILSAFKFLGQ